MRCPALEWLADTAGNRARLSDGVSQCCRSSEPLAANRLQVVRQSLARPTNHHRLDHLRTIFSVLPLTRLWLNFDYEVIASVTQDDFLVASHAFY